MAGRRLSADERALWARVTAGVRREAKAASDRRALEARDAAAPPALAVTEAVSEPVRLVLPKPAARKRGGTAGGVTAPAPTPAAAAAKANTLDGGWDRRLATGQIAPDCTIDLHGCGLDAAHRRLDHGMRHAITSGLRIVLLVTGKPPRAGSSRLDTPLRGIIRASVFDWLAAAPYADRIAAIRAAHPRHGGAGALYIILRRIRN